MLAAGSTLAWSAVGGVSAILALVYLSRGTFMPYHADALGLTWSELSPEGQVMHLALMRLAGGGWAGLAVLVFGTLALGERARAVRALVLPFATACVHGATLWATLSVTARTPATAPWLPETALLGTALFAVVLDRLERRRALGILAVLTLASAPRAASAEPPAAEDLTLDVRPLLDPRDPIDQGLLDAHATAEAWHGAWVATFAAGTTARVALGLTLDDPSLRTAQWAGAIPVAAGLLSQLLTPLPALDLDRDLEGAPDPAHRQALLRRYAQAEEARRGWLQHVLGIGTNAAAAAYLLLEEDAPLAAALQLGVGAVVTELRIWTAPRAATDALARATDRFARRPSSSPQAGSLRLLMGPGSLLVHLRF